MNSVRAIVVMAAATTLNACAPPYVEGPTLLPRAIDAYVAGDASSLAKVDAEAMAGLQKALDEPGRAQACTFRAAAARRAIIEVVMIRGLDQPTVMSMSETARYLNFRSVTNGGGGGAEGLPLEALDAGGPDCSRGNQALALTDNWARMRMLKMMIDRQHDWRTDLDSRYGGQMTARLREAARLLERYGYNVDVERAITGSAI